MTREEFTNAEMVMVSSSMSRLWATQTDNAEKLFEQLNALFETNPYASVLLRQNYAVFLVESRPEQLELATKLLEKAERDTERLLGSSHGNLMVARQALSRCYRMQSRFADAEQLATGLLRAQQERLGDSHPAVWRAAQTLADIHISQGENTEAIDLLEPYYEICTANSEPQSEDRLKMLAAMTSAYRNAGQFKKALPLTENLVQLSSNKYGPEHKKTIAARSGLVGAYARTNRVTDAIRAAEELVQQMRSSPTVSHPETRTMMHNLASYYSLNRQHQKALTLTDEVIRLRTQFDGPTAITTLSSRQDKVVQLINMGRVRESNVLLKELQPLLNSAVGPTGPLALQNQSMLADQLSQSGDVESAIEIWESVLPKFVETAGANATLVLQLRRNLGQALASTGRLRDGVKQLRTAHAASAQHRGADNEMTLSIHLELARAMSASQQFEEADRVWTEYIAVHRRAFGPQHLSLLEALVNRANTAHESQRFKHAEVCYGAAATEFAASKHQDHIANSVAIFMRGRNSLQLADKVNSEKYLKQAVQRLAAATGPNSRPTVRARMLLAACELIGDSKRPHSEFRELYAVLDDLVSKSSANAKANHKKDQDILQRLLKLESAEELERWLKKDPN